MTDPSPYPSPSHATAPTPISPAAVRAGSEAAFHALFDMLYAPLRRYALGYVDDVAAAEDLVQEAFVRLWDRRSSLDAETSLPGYLYRTVRNLGLNARRDRATRARLLEDPHAIDGVMTPTPFPDPQADVEREELTHRLRACLAALPPRQREAIELARFDGLSHGDIAIVMGCSPRTVNNHLVAALSTLRRTFAAAGSLLVTLITWCLT